MKPYYESGSVTLWNGDCRTILPTLEDKSVQCCVTSPPYFGLRDYGNAAQIGLEPTPDAYVAEMVGVFREVRRVLRDDGTVWLNLGDSYSGAGYSNHQNTGGAQRNESGKQRHTTGTGLKPKDIIGIPWRVAFALQADGWYLRQDIIWHKPNPMPESVTDRCTKAHEYVFLLSKSERYYYDADAIKEPGVSNGSSALDSEDRNADLRRIEGANLGKESHASGTRTGVNLSRAYRGVDWASEGRNKRSVWTIASQPYSGAHFATMPMDLVKPCVLAGSPDGGLVLDPFAGSGTTAYVARDAGRRFVGCELNPTYCDLAAKRLAQEVLQFP